VLIISLGADGQPHIRTLVLTKGETIMQEHYSYVTTRIAAEELQVSQTRILQLIYTGKLKAQKMGGIWMIPARDLALVALWRDQYKKEDKRFKKPAFDDVPF
jgi:hypothetical protein